MKNFRRILFVSQGLAPEIDALKQVLSTARNNGATLDALLISPAFPENLAAYKDRFEESLRERFAADLAAAREALKLDPEDLAALVYRAEIRLQKKRVRQAIEDLQKAIGLGSSSEPFVDRARRLLQMARRAVKR
jgi:tetratricopeptide (TPR) repeat protein